MVVVKRPRVVAGTVAVVGVLLLTIPASFFTEERYTAYTGALQALGVVVALIVAVQTLQSDSRARRVDRVLALHQELMSGDVGEARRRLADHLRRLRLPDQPGTQLSIAELRDGPPRIRTYEVHEAELPWVDASSVLRFFERADAALTARSIDPLLFVALVGRHACWWDLAFKYTERTARQPLSRVAEFSNSYFDTHKTEPSLAGWGSTRAQEFPKGRITAQKPDGGPN